MRNRERSDGGRITARLIGFSEFVVSESPAYAQICAEAADDPAVLRILGEADYDQPPANILLAAVQFLLFGDPSDPLATHYPSIVGPNAEASGDLVEHFVSFCHRNEHELRAIAATRTVQTNEVRRCVGVLPAFSWIAAQEPRPLALLEIGASAGLNLSFDRYRYDFGSQVVGPTDSPLTLHTEATGTLPVLDPLPRVSWRTGLDLHPVDVTDLDSIRWARSLLWPEQIDRIERFDRAVSIAAIDPPTVVQGDAIDSLADVARAAPSDAVLVVFHTFVLNQLDPTRRVQLTEVIESMASSRPVHRIGIDLVVRGVMEPEIKHSLYGRGTVVEQVLGTMHHHGAWLRWTA